MDEGFGLTEIFHRSLGHTLKGQIQVPENLRCEFTEKLKSHFELF